MSLGCAVVVLASVGAVVMPGGVFDRLHFLTPVTSVGIPLARRAGTPVLAALRRVHSGHIGDYVAWMMTGMTSLVAFVGLPLR